MEESGNMLPKKNYAKVNAKLDKISTLRKRPTNEYYYFRNNTYYL